VPGEIALSEVLVAQHSFSHGNRVSLSWSVSLLALSAFAFSVWATFVGFHHSLFDFHGFRQAQTALSAAYMEHGGPFLRYQTPVFGPPWSIPFEFPLYQKIVALIAEHLGTPLTETGRAVSIAFFYLCFFPLASILKRLGYRPPQILAVLSLFAASPLYIMVSRLFMIESTALFLSLMYADQMIRLVTDQRPWRYRHILSAAIFGVLAGIVKVTTFAPFFVLGAGVATVHILKRCSRDSLSTGRIVGIATLCGLLPCLCAVLWTRFADAVKSENPIGRYFTSKILAPWNFGTLDERLNPSNYRHFLHAVGGQAGSIVLLCLLVLLHAVLVRRWNWFALVSFSLYLFTPLVFFGLHLVHEYYPYASALFLLVAAGLLIADLLALPGRRAWVGFVTLAALLSACAYRYHGQYYLLQRENAPGRPGAAAVIDRTTAPDDVIVITGLDWSSELPYQSHRRAIMDAGSAVFWSRSRLGPISAAIHNQGASTIPEVVVCQSARESEDVAAILHVVGIPVSAPLKADDCDIYLRAAPSLGH
jgi:hypothetical protein